MGFLNRYVWVIMAGVFVTGLAAFGIQQLRVNHLKATVATIRMDLATSRANVSTLEGAISTQNEAVVRLQDRGEAIVAAGEARASEVLRASERRRADLPTTAGVGPEELNQWFSQQSSRF